VTEKLWIVDDDQSIRWVLQRALEKAQLDVTAFEFATDLLRQLREAETSELPDAVISDIRMPGMDGFELISEIHKLYPDLPVIIMTAHSDMDSAMSAYESGAFEYLPKPFDINEAIELLDEKHADAIVSVCEMEHSPLWSNTIGENGSMNNFLKDEVLNQRSQDLDTYFRLNGAIYICKVDKLLSEKSFFLKENIFAYKMNRDKSIDIDEVIDFKIAECLI